MVARLIAAALAALVVAMVWWRSTTEVGLPPPSAPFVADGVGFEDFVGADACQDCHAEQYRAWRSSTHGAAGSTDMPSQVVAPFDGGTIGFSDATVTPRRTPDGRYEFHIEVEGRAPETIVVLGAIGKGHMVGGGTQGFVAEYPDGTVRFLPFDWSATGRGWFCNTTARTGGGWEPIAPSLSIYACADWPPSRILGVAKDRENCQECHGSQITLSFDSALGRYRTDFTTLDVNCESCHGPGRRHVERAQAERLGEGADIGMTALATLGTDQSLEVCFQCHALKEVLHTGYLPGLGFERFYSLGLASLNPDGAIYPDGRVRTFGYQGTHRYSDCYLSGSMTCTDCHDPHSQGYRDVWGRELQSRFSDGQCLACHASKAEAPEKHTRHPAGSSGVRCVACHMPYLQHPIVGDGVRYARSDHTIPIPRPLADSSLGILNACSQCHGDRAVRGLEEQARRWWGGLKPRKPIVEAALGQGGADAWLDPSADHPMAQIAGLGRYVNLRVRLDMARLDPVVERRLRDLAGNEDIDVRAAALAALHVARGGDARTRRFLAGRLNAAGVDEIALRRRWATAVAMYSNGYLAGGDLRAAVRGYTRALEVSPDDPSLLVLLGVALNSAQMYDSAAVVLDRALNGDPYQMVGWLNLGVARDQRGDPNGAEEAYRRALVLGESEPLPRLALADLYRRRGRPDSAIAFYQQALALDPTRVPIRKRLVRLHVERRDLESALATVRAGLRLPTADPELRQMERALEQLARER